MESEIVLLIFSPIFKKAALIMTQTLVGKLDFFAKIIQPADRYAFELQTYPEEQIFSVPSTDFQQSPSLDTILKNSPKFGILLSWHVLLSVTSFSAHSIFRFSARTIKNIINHTVLLGEVTTPAPISPVQAFLPLKS